MVAKSETARIAEEQSAIRAIDVDNGIHNNFINHNISLAIARDLDDIRYTSALSAQNSNELYAAIQINNRVTHMFSKNTVLSFSDSASEQLFTTVKDIVSNDSQGLTNSEVKEATRISADLSTLTTTVVPLSKISNKCEDTILLKTMMVPIIKFNSRMYFKINNGLLQQS